MAVILVVDDDTLIRTTIKKLLERAGHVVLEASNGIEAESVAATSGIDLLITDIIMPDKEGLMLVRDLKKRMPDLRIIAMSGGGRAGAFTLLDAASQFGAQTVLRKPFRAGELLKAIDTALRATREQTAPPAH
jgi:CheY-like chemotaxis protein